MRVRPELALAAGLVLAAGSGYLASEALSSSSAAPTTTTTITLENGAPGPPGPPGPPGADGAQTCPQGFELGVLVINHPSGQTRIATCIE